MEMMSTPSFLKIGFNGEKDTLPPRSLPPSAFRTGLRWIAIPSHLRSFMHNPFCLDTNITNSHATTLADRGPVPSEPLCFSTPSVVSDYIHDGKWHFLFPACGSVATIKLQGIVKALYQHCKISVHTLLTKAAENFLAGSEHRAAFLRVSASHEEC